ncbi:sporulation protein YqfD [Peribacillus sp. SCS-155]|uniref:sporulation protein YqfD n=1 Tax=Peribacillus sedimenti TaxID=3115297 RepID=UPI003905B225
MKNQWTNFYTGYVKVKAYGKGTERLVNALVRNGIHVWDVTRSGPDSILFFMDLDEVPSLRKVVRKSDCKVSFVHGKGGPFILKRIMKNSGFLAGSIAFLISIFILSNMIWKIDVHNANPQTEHAIRKELKNIGVKVGKLQFLVYDAESIQRKLSERIDSVTWIGVELKGTTYHFQVVEKKQPKVTQKTSLQNLVAIKKAVITDMFIEKGQPKVKVNDYVNKGQLLVSGLIGKDDNPQIVGAKGVIKGETWYKSNVEVPLKTKFSVFNGEERTKHSLLLWKASVPIWGFRDPGYKSFETEVTERPFFFLQWKLPISYKTATKRNKEVIVRNYTAEQAEREAIKMAKIDLSKQLHRDARIVGEKILHRSIDNGKVKMTIHYQVIENIAAGQPIFQGD